ncbi:hypothetical protein [Mucilaginibacter sp. UR6-11]|uniref:hypothetical protein n=1 Tax=Mucilaginibacter sp. UR6-11 TaxID=1435644 RepID=UPI001E5BADBF|nr:hypothetical protein [Mucilaginibacter sp. UR6-11]MCC8424526.1 hypothetical protein [Mucilaginibacter sp. UR6-11]
MKKCLLTITTVLLLLMTAAVNRASAQVASGPSDATTAPPTAATDVAKVLCSGSVISMSGPKDPGGADYTKYHWYKIDVNGNKQEATTITGRTYTETSTTAGYYNYQVVTENANGCTSPLSDVFKVFVLPPLSVNITTPTTSMCAEAANSTLLTANVTPATGYTINYQWTRNGTPISGATSSTYNVTGETTAATVTFGVNVTYALNSTCSATNTKDITLTPLPTKPTITAN